MTSLESLPHEIILHILRLALNSSARTIDLTPSRSLSNLLYSSDLLQCLSLTCKTYCNLVRPILFHSLQVRGLASARRIHDVIKLEKNREDLSDKVVEIGFLITGEVLEELDIVVDILSICKMVDKVSVEASASIRKVPSTGNTTIHDQSSYAWPNLSCERDETSKPLSSLNIIGFHLPITLPYFTSLTSLTLTVITLEDGWKLSESFPAVIELNFGLSGGKGPVFEETRNFILNLVPQLEVLRLDGSRIMFGSLSILLVKEILSLSTNLSSLHISHLERDPTLPNLSSQSSSNQTPPPLPIQEPSHSLAKLHLNFDHNQFKHPMRAYSSGNFIYSSMNQRIAEGDVFVETFASYTREISRSLGPIRHIDCLSLPPWVESMGNSMGMLELAETKLRVGGTEVTYEVPHSFVKCSAWVNMTELRLNTVFRDG